MALEFGKEKDLATKEIQVPNIGGASGVEVIEILVSPGDKINKEDSLITLESDKASMEIPSPYPGIIENLKVKIGDKVSEGSLILTLQTQEDSPVSEKKATTPAATASTLAAKAEKIPSKKPAEELEDASQANDKVHAGPAVRRVAREFGINLNAIQGSGPKQRILTEDLQTYVKTQLNKSTSLSSGLHVSAMPEIDFSKFGAIEVVPLNKIKKLTGVNVHRSWITVPHVTQFDKADITELEEFRSAQKASIEKQGVKLTPLVFIMKAVIAALKQFPAFNASLDHNGEQLILKKYFNLGIAVDTPNGLVVPVVKDVDKKGLLELAKELAELSHKAREKGLSTLDMAGGCFTISSLGGIGGTAFTPIVNAPDVAILGISKASLEPIYEKGQFVPRLMLPLSLSYDHRVIDGAEGARFLVYLAARLSDIRTLLL